jgi:hypothetical protein
LQHYAGNSKWHVADAAGKRKYPVDERPRLEIFVIYDKPADFFYKEDGVWVEAMRLMFKRAGVTGFKRPESISAKVTTYCHSGHGMIYETVMGRPRFKVSPLGGDFELMNYITKKKGDNLYNIVNCYDQAAAVQAFCACLGVDVSWIFQYPFGYIKTTDLVGVGMCNNPFYKSNGTLPIVPDDDSGRTRFGNHAFIENGNTGAYIRDACAGPRIGEEDLRSYLESSIDLDCKELPALKRRLTPDEKNSRITVLMRTTKRSTKTAPIGVEKLL